MNSRGSLGRAFLCGLALTWGAVCQAAESGAASAGPVRSGHATAELLLESPACQAGDVLVAGVRLVLDQGWHSYWVNPGEAGMATRLEWRLPTGWSLLEQGQPFPRRFETGGLPGYGHEGEVVYPVVMRAGPLGAGGVKLGVKAAWLTCSEGGCVPGEVNLELAVALGKKQAGPAASVLRRARERVPVEWAGARLELQATGGEWELQLWPPAGARVEVGALRVFAETPQVLDAGAEVRFAVRGDHWVARVKRSEYATGEVKGLALVMEGGALARPVRVAWRGGD
jgi:thiol:disulfide interchange protein DsbD